MPHLESWASEKQQSILALEGGDSVSTSFIDPHHQHALVSFDEGLMGKATLSLYLIRAIVRTESYLFKSNEASSGCCWLVLKGSLFLAICNFRC